MPLHRQAAAPRPAAERGSCCSTPLGTVPQADTGCCAPAPDPRNTAVDPICKMVVDRASPGGGSVEAGGETYFFCSTFCRARFVSVPR